MSGGGERVVEKAHMDHVADVESRHPKFGAFLRRATEDPEVREAYYAAQRRRDGEGDADSAAEPGPVMEPGNTDSDAGLESESGGAPATPGLEAASEPAGEVGRARTGLNADPYDHPVWVQGHSHAEPICAWPDCTTYLTRAEMAALRISHTKAAS